MAMGLLVSGVFVVCGALALRACVEVVRDTSASWGVRVLVLVACVPTGVLTTGIAMFVAMQAASDA